MKKITLFSFLVLFFLTTKTNAQSVDPITAWWANENFDSYTAGDNAPEWTYLGGNGSDAASTFYKYKNVNPENLGNASGIVLSITSPEGSENFSEPNTNRSIEVEKSFSNDLSGYVYATFSGYTCTRATAYTFLNKEGHGVFGVSGQNGIHPLRYQLSKPGQDGTYLSGSFTAFNPSTGDLRSNRFQVEMILNLTESVKEVVKIKTTVGTNVQI